MLHNLLDGVQKNVTGVNGHCSACKIVQALPLTERKQLHLPRHRLWNDYTLGNTGADFIGPSYLKNIYGDTLSNLNFARNQKV